MAEATPRTPEAYDTICSIGELIDKLSIENIKCYDANSKILAERAKESPDPAEIAALEWRARSSGEQRVRLRQEINERMREAIGRGRIETAPDVRTYDLRQVRGMIPGNAES
jgi:hypothetical protein